MGKSVNKVLYAAVAGVAALAFSTPSYAIFANGVEKENFLGGNSWEIIFDEFAGGDIRNGDQGLRFNYAGTGLTLTITDSTAGAADSKGVVQDNPAHGGIGRDGKGSDNLDLGEILKFKFSSVIALDAASFNGTHNQNGHQDNADGAMLIGDANSDDTAFLNQTAGFVNLSGLVGDEFLFTPLINTGTRKAFSGYIEALRFRVRRNVPEPASLILLSAGLLGIGFAGKRRARLSS